VSRADIVVIVLLAALVGWSAAAWWSPARGTATDVEIRSGRDLVGRYSLLEAQQLEVEGRAGISEIHIHGGRARFVAGPCRNKVCVHSGWLSQGGDAAACVPNGVSMRLTGSRSEFDGLAH
jgi:hypothetical protein